VPRKSPYRIKLSRHEKARLEAAARRYTSPYRDVIRAKIILHAAQGLSNEASAHRLDMPRQSVSQWRKRYFEEGLQGLEERSRAGRPVRFSPQGRDRDPGPGV
jgi:DNA-directed RNA polymerase specialized sigma24 family protein